MASLAQLSLSLMKMMVRKLIVILTSQGRSAHRDVGVLRKVHMASEDVQGLIQVLCLMTSIDRRQGSSTLSWRMRRIGRRRVME